MNRALANAKLKRNGIIAYELVCNALQTMHVTFNEDGSGCLFVGGYAKNTTFDPKMDSFDILIVVYDYVREYDMDELILKYDCKGGILCYVDPGMHDVDCAVETDNVKPVIYRLAKPGKTLSSKEIQTSIKRMNKLIS